MARFQCRWGNVLICMCICFLLAVIGTAVELCAEMMAQHRPSTEHTITENPHFVAPGTFRNNSLAQIPITFWAESLKADSLWNNLQLAIERHYNPILRPNLSKMKVHNDSPLRDSFSEVVEMDKGLRDLDVLPKPIQDFVSSMQNRDYPILIQPGGVCGAGEISQKKPPLLLLAIKSSEVNFRNRQAIRRTWGQVGWVAGHNRNLSGDNKVGAYVRRIFLIAKENPEDLGVDISHVLQTENQLYGDILQWDFRDTFFNLTLKDVLFWSWFSRVCGRTRFVFKGDDDVLVNTGKLVTYLQKQLMVPNAYKNMKDFMVGHVISGAQPVKVESSKYFIPERFYKGFYPTYTGGGGVVYSGQLTRRLHAISQRVHLFPIDDVYVGMCMVRLDVSPINHPAFLTFDIPEKEQKQRCLYHRILLVHQRLPNEIMNLWEHMQKTQAECWDVPLRD